MPNLLVVYPWGVDTILYKSNGAGCRVSMLVSFLVEHGHSVTVVSGRYRSKKVSRDGVTYVDLRFPTNPLIFVLYAALAVLGSTERTRGLKALSYFILHRYDKRFIRELRSFILQHDLVFLEYPFWGEVVCSLKKPTILTNHDVIARAWSQGEGSTLHRIISGMEISALRAATRVVAVSQEDCDYFIGKNLERVVSIPNPVQMADDNPSDQEDCSASFTPDSPFRSYALFVGSGWYPNRAAVAAIINEVAPRCPDIGFILAGRSSEGVSRQPGNVFPLGVVSGEELKNLYRKCTFVLVAVPWGTGTALKTLEALAASRVVLSTPAGIRGLPFINGKHGVVCDSVSRFPEEIYRLLDNEPRQREIMENGKQLAMQYDYHEVYRGYLSLIDECLERKT